MKTYTLIHTHKHGTSFWVFQSARDDVPTGWHGGDDDDEDEDGEPSLVMQLCKSLGVDFEPDREEYLDIDELPSSSGVWS